MSKKSIAQWTKGAETLRHNAVLYEADQDDKALEKALKRRDGKGYGTRNNVLHLDLTHEVIQEHAAEHSGFLPRARKGSKSERKTKERQLNSMKSEYGELVLLTFHVRKLDSLPLKSKELVNKARLSVNSLLRIHSPRCIAYIAAIQRGGKYAGTHVHIVLPLAQLSQKFSCAVAAAPAGLGGGVELIPGRLHGVLIGDTDDDLAAVASYLSRDPDGRYDLPLEHPDHLAAVAEDLARKASGERLRLGWSKGV